MIHSLTIENFMSVRDRHVIDLGIGAAVNDNAERYADAWSGSAKRVPKVVAFFGPNAAGKSTVLRAIQHITWFVRDSFQFQANTTLPIEPFWGAGLEGEPIKLAIEFDTSEKWWPAPDNLPGLQVSPETCRYSYEVQFEYKNFRRSVLSEALYSWPSYAKRKIRLFERDANGDVSASIEFGLAKHKAVLKQILRDNASVISTLAQLDHEPSKLLQTASRRINSNIFIEKSVVNELAMLQFFQANPDFIESANRDLSNIDLGIRSMSVASGPHGPIANFAHEGLSRPVPLPLESHGTRQFLHVYPHLAHTLKNGGIAVIDELDLAIHPLVLPEILRWFYSPERNPFNAQLWITCQNVSLLEELTKEEIYFCEKDAAGGTSIYGLKDIQGVRRVDNFYRKYMGGAFGAVPTIG
ncbi:hypothetical protein B0G62_12246 [Paraburkholderia eburnea]|uniref:ATPase AAA-type core domain-containing protein n=1 Tax=Paraburkholderia eburnea TaxID=1189126 RepID=A0A2S4LWB3_9BURK|nr:AAA family ATPase [Paraburkholderia eburnea]POR46730.1 hypothetical protein B0G62_12246 [Paraburkholderia eburnea]PRZ17919.1 hypothetical protein BX588_12246 [Paraburkholderia eburnea]